MNLSSCTRSLAPHAAPGTRRFLQQGPHTPLPASAWSPAPDMLLQMAKFLSFFMAE